MAKITNIKFEDYSDKVIDEIKSKIIAALYEVAGELRDQAKRNSRVDLGDLKRSWSYRVDESKFEARIGSTEQNSIWEEFGTGEHAVSGNGRKTPWKYQDRHGQWHTTRGKKPNKTLENAYLAKRKTIKGIFERCLK